MSLPRLEALVLFPALLVATACTTYGQQDAFVAKVDADTLEARWITQLGSSEFDWVTDMTLGPQGQAVVVGETFGAFDPAAQVGGVGDVFAFQVDARGNVSWTWQDGSLDNETATSVVIDGCGDVIIGGSTNGDFLGPTSGRRDGFVVRARASDG